MGTIINICVFFILILYIYWMFKKNRELMFLLIPVVYVYIWCIVSVIYLESGNIYISDLNMKSGFNFSALKLMGYFFIFLTSIYISFHTKHGVLCLSKHKDRRLSINDKQCKFMIGIAILVAVTWLVDVVLSGNVLTNLSLTRFNYWDSYSKIPFMKYMFYFINPLSFILGLIFAKSENKKYKGICTIVVITYFILNYLVGNQFSGLLGILIYFIMPILFIKYSDFTKKQKRTILMMLVFVFIVVGTIKIRALTDYDEFANRFLVLQGDLWFATDIHITKNGPNFPALFDSIKNLFNGDAYEMDYLMKLVMPLEKYMIFKKGNVALYSGFPAYEISIFGYIFSIPIIAIEGWIYGKFMTYINKKIRSKDMVVVLLAIYLLVQYNKVFNMCGYSYLFNGLPILCIIFMTTYETIININKNNK